MLKLLFKPRRKRWPVAYREERKINYKLAEWILKRYLK